MTQPKTAKSLSIFLFFSFYLIRKSRGYARENNSKEMHRTL